MNICDNCGKQWNHGEMEDISDFFDRTEPGGMVPAGQCPECGALCYPVETEEEFYEERHPSQGGESYLAYKARRARERRSDRNED